jgi:hypothetical protein
MPQPPPSLFDRGHLTRRSDAVVACRFTCMCAYSQTLYVQPTACSAGTTALLQLLCVMHSNCACPELPCAGFESLACSCCGGQLKIVFVMMTSPTQAATTICYNITNTLCSSPMGSKGPCQVARVEGLETPETLHPNTPYSCEQNPLLATFQVCHGLPACPCGVILL